MTNQATSVTADPLTKDPVSATATSTLSSDSDAVNTDLPIRMFRSYFYS